MQPLLKIQNIPISIEYKIQRAALEHKSAPAQVQVTRTPGSRSIQRTPPKLNIDSYETRASAGLKSPARAVQETASSGQAAAKEATRTYAEEGNSIVEGGSAADVAASRVPQPAETALAFIPSVAPEISVTPGTLSFDYSMDKLTFDWNINHKPQLEFVPGSIEFSVTQYPEVVIEYMGSPIYVPPAPTPTTSPPPTSTSTPRPAAGSKTKGPQGPTKPEERYADQHCVIWPL